MANKQLTAAVRLNTTQFEQKLKRIARAVDALNKAVNKESNAYNAVNNALGKTEQQQRRVKKEVERTKVATKQWGNAQTEVLKKINSSKSALGGLGSKLKGVLGMYMGIQGIGLMLNTSDTITKSENQLNNIEGGSPERTAKAMDKVYVAAQRSRGSYSAMLSDVGKLMTLSADAFQNNEDNAIRFQEIMNKAYKLGNMSAAEQATSMYQLVQALGSGILQGDELRSVREGASLMYKEMEKNIQAVLETDKSLKDLAADGLVTSDLVVWAVMQSGDKIDNQFKKTDMTFEDVATHIKNVAVQMMRKVQDRLVTLFNSEKGEKFLENISNAIVVAGNALIWLIDVFASFFNWSVDNWDWLKHAIVGALMLMITWTLIKAGISIFCAYQEIKAWMIANKVTWATIASLLTMLAVIAIVVMAVMALVYVFFLWRTGAIDTCDAIVDALTVVAIAAAIVALLIGSWVWAIVAVVAIAIALIINYLDYFLGIVYSIASFIYNLAVGVIDGILQLIYTMMEPILVIVEWIANCFNGGFNSIGDACANLVGQMIGWFLSLGKVVTKIIDAIFGTNWTDGLESLRQSVTSWGKNEKAITLTQDAPTLNSITGGALPERISYANAWDTGMKHGAAAQGWMNDVGSKFQNMNGKFNQMSDLPNINDNSLAVNNSYDPTGANSDIADALDKLNGATDDISDKMDISEDDLDYLRRIAEMEWRNEFTTAEIKIDMTNNNTVNSDRDLDGIVEYLSEVLLSEMNTVASGVHY